MFITHFQCVYSLSWFGLFWFLEPIASEPRSNVVFKGMENLTKRLGQSFFEFSNSVTKFNELRDSFSKNAESIEDVNIQELFTEVMSKVNGSLQGRVDAIQKIAAFAEPRAFDHYSSLPSPKERKKDPPIPRSYFNSKLINRPPSEDKDEEEEDDEEDKYNCTFPTELPLARNDHFKTDVNLNVTSVHVPTSIYECDPPLLEALVWSSDLEETFKNNYQQNPTLGWQYFGSSTGFLRQYPASQWPNDNSDKDSPDLYDCRFRPWYTASATSPKNLLILLDVSGSMTGLRSRIAKAVVNSLLDTLTENDYVNVFKFSDQTEVLVDCTNDTGNPILIQATMENLRDQRVAMEQKQTKGMGNFTEALTKAFDSLRTNQGENESSNCNQAVMVVTDGAPDYFEALFEKLNKKKRIRVFTYLVGREVTDKKEVEWMACHNQGYFVHVSTLGEVQEQVIKYLPVMSRPLVMSQRREVNWTPVYAHHAELVESEWQWEEQTRQRQKDRSERYKWFYQNVAENNVKKGANKSAIHAFSDGRKKDEKNDVFILALHKLKTYLDYGATNISYRSIRRMEAEKERMIRILQDSRDGPRSLHRNPYVTKIKDNSQSQMLVERNRQMFKDFEFRKFNFFVSASYPVFDIRNYTNTSYSPKERIANFLGVVGTDISIAELKNLASPFELGVNAYAFVITNNGHIVFHPDFRPLYENILKPTYNSVDLTEVELVDADGLHRNNDEQLLLMRKEMIDKEGPVPSTPKVLPIRIHQDGFKRVSIRNQVYVYGKIPRTHYTLAIQVPVNASTYRGEVEVSLLWKDKHINIVERYFDFNVSYRDEEGQLRMLGRNWRIHPDWTYCHYLTPMKLDFLTTKEDVFVHFIKRIQGSSPNSSWAWGSTTLGWGGKEGDHYVCNRKLVQSVVFDAMITKPFSETHEILQDSKLRSLVASFGAELLSEGVLTTLVSTRSGLTRWIDHPKNREKPTDLPFTEYHPRAIEESWYQRTVARAAIEDDSYVVSVAFDAGTGNFSRVTVTRAIMAAKAGKRAPVGVAGIQYDLDKFLSFFGIGPEYKRDERNICQDDAFHCFILDENAFVIGSSEIRDDSGQFFGEVDRHAMEALLNSSIYKEVRVVDFQAVCFQQIIRTSFANILLTPFRQMRLIFNWFLGYLASFLLGFNLPFVLASSEPEYDDEEDISGDRNMPFVEYAYINKTKLRPCDVERKLFMYGTGYNVGMRTLDRRSRFMCEENCEDYLNVQRIPHTNLILVIVEAKCRCGQRGGHRHRRTIHGSEVEYPLYRTFVNRSSENPILMELCRIPQPPLYRKRLAQCHAYDEEEFFMKEDCGRATSLASSGALILLATTVGPILLRL